MRSLSLSLHPAIIAPLLRKKKKAEQVPYGVVVSIINRLASSAFKEIAFVYGVDSEVERLKETAEAIKAALIDAERKQRNEQLIKLWIRRLKQVLLKADDLLDDLQTQHLLHKRDGKRKVRDYFSSSNPIAFRLKIARKIRKIRGQFNAVAEDVSKLNLDSRVLEVRHSEKNWRETSSKHEENIIGREESKKQIIDLLLNTNSNQRVSVVAIVGMGGLGKTALAQLVYNNAEVNKFFSKQMWVCASEEFHVKGLVKKILESSIGNDVNDQQLQLLQNKLEENLNAQRYLLVLDDVWNEDEEKWLHLKKYLMCGVEGSKILVTTRNQMVARCMGAEDPFVLKNLTKDQSWDLLKRFTFGQDRVVTQNLESIGQKIAEKCGGVPLAIRAMGSMLSKIEENIWESILDDDFWDLYESNYSIMPVLKLSYDQLSFELRQCFAYCSLYAKNWRYDKDDLIELWMAQGFLESRNEKQCPEDVGERYVCTLWNRSFLEDVEMNEFGEIKYFRIHNLIHDLLQSVASSDCYLYNERRKMVATPMHVSFECDSNCSLDLLNTNRLRSMLGIQGLLEIDPSSLLDFKCLRSLNLSECLDIKDLPNSIGKLKHLRYLNLSHCENLTSLPKSVSNLVNLQTLKLMGCYALRFSIDYVTKLVSLRHLHIDNCKAFEGGMPIGLDRLTALHSLSGFRVGNNDTGKERKYAKLNELRDFNLRHELSIENLNLVRDVGEESNDVNLKAKKNLKSLRLDWGRDAEAKNSDSLQLLEKLCPHPNLKQLTVEDYPGERFSGWLSSLTNLVDLKLDGCRNCQYLPSLEPLVSLKTLCIWNMDDLEYICYEACSSSMAAHGTSFFPSLKDIYFSDCQNFRGWKGESDANNQMNHSLPPFPCLSYLIIHDCPNLSSMPTFNLVERLVLKNCCTKPLVDTVTSGSSSATQELNPPLSMLQYLGIQDLKVEALPEEWMRNLTSLNNLSIGGLSNLVTVFRHMRHLPATLEQVNFQGIRNLDPWSGVDEGFRTQCQNLRCFRSLQTIHILFSENPRTLPGWIFDLQSLQFIIIHNCRNLESLPEGLRRLVNLKSLQLNGDLLLMQMCERGRGSEWPKIAHIPNIWVNGYQI